VRRKRCKSPSPVLDRRSFADRGGFAPSVRRQMGRVGGRPVCHPTSVSSGLAWPRAAVRWGGVSRVVKTASSRGRTGRTLFGHGDSCSPQAPSRAQECCGKAYSFVLMSLYRSLHPSRHADQR
jgi:hypothetical protein